MMEASSNHQKQKLSPVKPHRLARSIIRQFVPSTNPRFRKRAGLIGVGLVAGIGVPVLAYTTHQDTSNHKTQTTVSASTTVQKNTSSNTEEVLSFQGKQSSDSRVKIDPNASTKVTINGQSVPLKNGTVKQIVTDSTGSQVEVNISVDHSSDSSNSSSTTTDISVESHSSQSSDEQNITRGSPRR